MGDSLADQSASDSRPGKWSKTIRSGPRIRKSFYSLDAYTRHKILVNEYLLNRPGATSLLQRDTSADKTDYDILAENHRFLWDYDDEDEDRHKAVETGQPSDRQCWGRRLAKKYYDNLFKEFTICDLSRYKENKVAMRWRTEAEVVEGKGQFICGEKSCPANSDLRTWEVNFKYEEQGTTKNALVKQRLCPKCSDMLNFRQKRKEVKTKHKQKTKRQKVKRDNEERAIKKRKHERNRSQSRLSSSSSPSSSPHSKAGRSKSHKKKRRSYSEADTGERFLDQFWEDMMS